VFFLPDLPELKIRQKIMVARKGENQWYASAVQDIRNSELYIEMPTQKAHVLVLYPGIEAEIKFFGKDASFVFTTLCHGKTSDSIPLYRLAPPQDIRRIQQRRFVRWPTAIEVFYALPPEKNRRPGYKKGTAVDISGGGMKLKVGEPVPEGASLLLKFSLPSKKETKEISVVGKVIRLWTIETGSKATYHAALEFTDISRTQQDYIINYIFSRMAGQVHLR